MYTEGITKDITDDNAHTSAASLTDKLGEVPELDIKRALASVGGSTQAYEHIVRLSLRRMPESMRRLNALIDGGLPEYSGLVHALKGTLNNIGAYGLGEMANGLEYASKNGDIDGCRQAHALFAEAFDRLYARVSALAEQVPAERKPNGDKALLCGALAEIETAVDLYDSVRALAAISAVGKFAFGPPCDGLLADLAHAFEVFDFDAAAELKARLQAYLEDGS